MYKKILSAKVASERHVRSIRDALLAITKESAANNGQMAEYLDALQNNYDTFKKVLNSLEIEAPFTMDLSYPIKYAEQRSMLVDINTKLNIVNILLEMQDNPFDLISNSVQLIKSLTAEGVTVESQPLEINRVHPKAVVVTPIGEVIKPQELIDEIDIEDTYEAKDDTKVIIIPSARIEAEPEDDIQKEATVGFEKPSLSSEELTELGAANKQMMEESDLPSFEDDVIGISDFIQSYDTDHKVAEPAFDSWITSTNTSDIFSQSESIEPEVTGHISDTDSEYKTAASTFDSWITSSSSSDTDYQFDSIEPEVTSNSYGQNLSDLFVINRGKKLTDVQILAISKEPETVSTLVYEEEPNEMRMVAK